MKNLFIASALLCVGSMQAQDLEWAVTADTVLAFTITDPSGKVAGITPDDTFLDEIEGGHYAIERTPWTYERPTDEVAHSIYVLLTETINFTGPSVLLVEDVVPRIVRLSLSGHFATPTGERSAWDRVWVATRPGLQTHVDIDVTTDTMRVSKRLTPELALAELEVARELNHLDDAGFRALEDPMSRLVAAGTDTAAARAALVELSALLPSVVWNNERGETLLVQTVAGLSEAYGAAFLPPLNGNALPAALTLLGPAFRIQAPSQGTINGGNHTLSGTLLPGGASHGVVVGGPEVGEQAAVLASFTTGVMGSSDVAVRQGGELPFPAYTLPPPTCRATVLRTLSEPDPLGDPWAVPPEPAPSGPPTLSGTHGSVDAPAYFYAPSDLLVDAPLTGTGVLVVDGNLTANAAVDWTGLVVVRGRWATYPNRGYMRAQMYTRSNLSILGGLVVQSLTPDAAVVAFEGGAVVRYSDEAARLLPRACSSQELPFE